MRVKHALRNITTSLLLGFLVIIANFALQRVIALSLGVEYLGINSLFITTIALLSVAELGFGSAIVYHLYEPLKDNNWTRINILMAFYRKIYLMVAVIVFCLGVLLLPFLHLIVGQNQLDTNIYIIFILFLSSSVISYLMSYKRSLLQADQKGYLIDSVYTCVYILVVILQIIALTITRNYYIFLVGNVVLVVTSNLIINHIVHKRYANFVTKEVSKIDIQTSKHIFKQVQGLIFHKTSSFIVPSSSNMIISLFLGLKSLGLASNYFLIAGAITTMTWKVSSAITASVGNLLVDASKAKMYEVYKRLQLGAMLFATLISTIFFVIVDSFVKLWVGEDYVLGLGTVLAFSVTIYLTIIRIVPNSYKQAAGIFYEDKYIPVIEATINIIMGVILVMLFGLEGVFWGLALSTLFLHIYAYPKYVYGAVLNKPRGKYLYDLIPYVATTVLIGSVMYIIKSVLNIENTFYNLITLVVTNFALVLAVWICLYGRTSEAKYYKELLLNIIEKTKK